jgi:hypothetical protein
MAARPWLADANRRPLRGRPKKFLSIWRRLAMGEEVTQEGKYLSIRNGRLSL